MSFGVAYDSVTDLDETAHRGGAGAKSTGGGPGTSSAAGAGSTSKKKASAAAAAQAPAPAPAPPAPNRSSNYIGVSRYKQTSRFEAHIWLSNSQATGANATAGNQAPGPKKGAGGGKKEGGGTVSKRGRQLHLGSFPEEPLAALAYDRAAYYIRGEDAELNFRKDYSSDPIIKQLGGRGLTPEAFCKEMRALMKEDKKKKGGGGAGAAAGAGPSGGGGGGGGGGGSRKRSVSQRKASSSSSDGEEEAVAIRALRRLRTARTEAMHRAKEQAGTRMEGEGEEGEGAPGEDSITAGLREKATLGTRSKPPRPPPAPTAAPAKKAAASTAKKAPAGGGKSRRDRSASVGKKGAASGPRPSVPSHGRGQALPFSQDPYGLVPSGPSESPPFGPNGHSGSASESAPVQLGGGPFNSFLLHPQHHPLFPINFFGGFMMPQGPLQPAPGAAGPGTSDAAAPAPAGPYQVAAAPLVLSSAFNGPVNHQAFEGPRFQQPPSLFGELAAGPAMGGAGAPKEAPGALGTSMPSSQLLQARPGPSTLQPSQPPNGSQTSTPKNSPPRPQQALNFFGFTPPQSAAGAFQLTPMSVQSLFGSGFAAPSPFPASALVAPAPEMRAHEGQAGEGQGGPGAPHSGIDLGGGSGMGSGPSSLAHSLSAPSLAIAVPSGPGTGSKEASPLVNKSPTALQPTGTAQWLRVPGSLSPYLSFPSFPGLQSPLPLGSLFGQGPGAGTSQQLPQINSITGFNGGLLFAGLDDLQASLLQSMDQDVPSPFVAAPSSDNGQGNSNTSREQIAAAAPAPPGPSTAQGTSPPVGDEAGMTAAGEATMLGGAALFALPHRRPSLSASPLMRPLPKVVMGSPEPATPEAEEAAARAQLEGKGKEAEGVMGD